MKKRITLTMSNVALIKQIYKNDFNFFFLDYAVICISDKSQLI